MARRTSARDARAVRTARAWHAVNVSFRVMALKEVGLPVSHDSIVGKNEGAMQEVSSVGRMARDRARQEEIDRLNLAEARKAAVLRDLPDFTF